VCSIISKFITNVMKQPKMEACIYIHCCGSMIHQILIHLYKCYVIMKVSKNMIGYLNNIIIRNNEQYKSTFKMTHINDEIQHIHLCTTRSPDTCINTLDELFQNDVCNLINVCSWHLYWKNLKTHKKWNIQGSWNETIVLINKNTKVVCFKC
jgi:hypothetical protein